MINSVGQQASRYIHAVYNGTCSFTRKLAKFALGNISANLLCNFTYFPCVSFEMINKSPYIGSLFTSITAIAGAYILEKTAKSYNVIDYKDKLLLLGYLVGIFTNIFIYSLEAEALLVNQIATEAIEKMNFNLFGTQDVFKDAITSSVKP